MFPYKGRALKILLSMKTYRRNVWMTMPMIWDINWKN
jgi:hypothetical protein